MKTLKDLKDALNSIEDDELLERFYISHGMTLEDPDPDIQLVFFEQNDEIFEKCQELLDEHPAMEVISDFARSLNDVAKKSIICKIDDFDGIIPEDMFYDDVPKKE